jgi:phosphotransferase system  glucose/maltose/N-acetylglucosamine-specific IIC component
MPNSALAEVYFIAAMMILILIICGVSVYFFFKTFYKEKRFKEKLKEAEKRKKAQKSKSEKVN